MDQAVLHTCDFSSFDRALTALRAARDPEQRPFREHNLNEVEYQLLLLRKRELKKSWAHPATREKIAG